MIKGPKGLIIVLPAAALGALCFAASSADAATVCVSHKAHSGCKYTSIQDAVNGVSAGDTINVLPGRYKEQVEITKPLSLIGSGSARTVIDAAGKAHGIFIDGGIVDSRPSKLPTANSLSEVTVAGFTVENANYEGILAANASFVTLRANKVADNDKGLLVLTDIKTCSKLNPRDPAVCCPKIDTSYETDEQDDCGEGIHLMGVDHAAIIDNHVTRNSGGILISDETGPSHNNVIRGNAVDDNAYDCGITLASHGAATFFAPHTLPFGVYQNTIADNISNHNGYSGSGGAGVGLFAPGPGNKTYSNVVIGNRLTDNGHPGVSIHNHTLLPHAPAIVLNDNAVVGNSIARNGIDNTVEGKAAAPTGVSVLATSPVSGTLILENRFEHETTDIAIAGNDGATVDVHLNNLTAKRVGIATFHAAFKGSPISAGHVNAQQNWWGCARGPGAHGCSSVSAAAGSTIATAPYLSAPPVHH